MLSIDSAVIAMNAIIQKIFYVSSVLIVDRFYKYLISSPGGQNATQQKVNFSGEAKNYFPS